MIHKTRDSNNEGSDDSGVGGYDGRYGRAVIDPCEPIQAGQVGTWTLSVTIGKHGIDDGGAVAIARRDISDWEIPQFDRPRASGYVTVRTDGEASLRLRYDRKCYVRPWRAALVVDVYDGSLGPGDTVWITLGDTDGGGPGMRAQTFPASSHAFKVLVDAFGTGLYHEVEPSPSLQIDGGPPDQLQVVVPSMVNVAEPFALTIRALDSWGNPSPLYRESVTLRAENVRGMPDEIVFRGEDRGVVWVEGLEAVRAGRVRFSAVDSGGREAESNPLTVREGWEFGQLYWGDMHGQTEHTVGTGSIDEYLRFARDVAALDVTSWQGNDFQITNEDWHEIAEQIEGYYEPGRFVTFLGYEWSGLTPAGGDYNVYFRGDEGPLHRSSHWLIDDTSDECTDRYPISELFAEWDDRRDVMAIPHVGGRYANLDFYDERFTPVVEVHSHHGTFEWMVEEAIQRGLQVGFIAASDDHTCRPGLSYPTRRASRGLCSFDVKGGYAGIYASELSREAIWDAIFRRHTYGTTGQRILLQVTTPAGAMMGDTICQKDAPQLDVEIGGTAPLFSVEIRRGLETVYRWPEPQQVADLPSHRRRLAVVWSGVRVRSRQKKACWDGALSIRGGGVRSVEPFAFDQPDEGITRLSTHFVSWRSTTSGDPDGLLIDTLNDEGTIRFASEPVSFELALSEVGERVVTFDGGDVNLQVQVFWVPTEAPADLSFSFQDPAPPAGCVCPYWVRIVQRDGHMAWSSPIYCTASEEG